MTIRKFFIAILFLIIFLLQANAATYLDPSLKWKTIETLHFKINYYPELEFYAIKMASIVEDVHSRLSPLFKHTPDFKTDVVLMDTTDYSNGFTTVFPNPLITLYIADLGSNSTPYSYEEWLRYVFIHEYTHLLHLDTVEGGGVLFKLLFGRMIFPNAINPQFIIEGLATFVESKLSKGGRLYNSRWKAMMRMDALENNFKSIDQASVTTVKWPMGNIAYLYGVNFLEYLSKTYGEKKIYRLSREYGDYVFSYGPDGAFIHLFGKSLNALWNDWVEYEEKKATDEKKKIEKDLLTTPVFLTNKGYYNLKAIWDKDSSSLYYTQINADDQSQIRKVNIKTLKSDKIKEGIFFDDAISLMDDKLYFSKGDIYNNFYFFKDIYSLNLKNNSITRLTNGLRAADPNASHDGKRIVFTRNHLGMRSLWLMDNDGKNLKALTSFEAGIQYMSPVFSPYDRTIAAAKWIKGGYQKIVLIDAGTGKERFLTSLNLSLEANPSFSPDGRYLLFDADISGVVNIYAFDLQSDKIYKVTNVLGVAEMPQVSPDQKKIAYVGYSSKGYDIALIDFNPSSWKDMTNRLGQPVLLLPRVAEDVSSSAASSEVILNKYNYNPLPSLIPKFWFPYSFSDENGSHVLGYTAGVDSLQQQYFALGFGYDATAKRASYTLLYTNDQFLPQLSVLAADYPTRYSWDSGNSIYWERERTMAFYAALYDNRVFSEFDRQALQIGYELTNLSNISSLEPLVIKPSLGNLSGVAIGYAYTSLKSYGYSVAPEEGMDLSLFTRLYSKQTGSDYNITSYTVSGGKYFKAFAPHNVIGLNAIGVLVRGDSIAQSGYTSRSISIRGYPYTSISGNKAVSGSVKYLFPISYPEIGYGYGYMFLDRIFGSFYYTQAGATSGSIYDLLWKKTIGAELKADTINGWGVFPVAVTLGYAKGLDFDGEDQIYFNITL